MRDPIAEHFQVVKDQLLNQPKRMRKRQLRFHAPGDAWGDTFSCVFGIHDRRQCEDRALANGSAAVALLAAQPQGLPAAVQQRLKDLPLPMLIDLEYWHDHDGTRSSFEKIERKYTRKNA